MIEPDNLKSCKTTFMLLGSNNNRIQKSIQKVKDDHDVYITRTDILNIAVDTFFKHLEEEGKNINDYLIEYNKL